MTCGEEEVGVLLRIAASQGSVRVWDAVVAGLPVEREQVRQHGSCRRNFLFAGDNMASCCFCD